MTIRIFCGIRIWGQSVQHTLQQTLLQQGLDLTVYGMGTVFVFLSLLVVCTMAMSAIVEKYFHEPQLDVVKTPGRSVDSDEVSPQLLAVIQAAIHEHRAKTRK